VPNTVELQPDAALDAAGPSTVARQQLEAQRPVLPGVEVNIDLSGAALQAFLLGIPLGYQPLASSMLLGVEYHPESLQLAATFVSGRTYYYVGVPLLVYAGLLNAPSKGRYMRSTIIGVYG
jgi:hypothetical protein